MTPEQIAAAFRKARQAATALDAYPDDELPASLDSAYAIQEIAIEAWDDQVVGWKVAAVQPAFREKYPAERLAGPVFSRTVHQGGDTAAEVPVIENGYAAVEAEFAVRIAKAVPPLPADADPASLLPYVEGVYAAFEIAASPLASLSALGPGAVISDFGNNSGLVLGARLPMTVLTEPSSATAVTEINGSRAGEGGAAKVPGGPLAAVLFLARHLAARGRGLKEGDWVSTGASTGIHPVRPGDTARAVFNHAHAVSAVIVKAGS
ncbi:MAG: 2-keto-4-pentenoate hydratase [Burkholderiaceae bacterium]